MSLQKLSQRSVRSFLHPQSALLPRTSAPILLSAYRSHLNYKSLTQYQQQPTTFHTSVPRSRPAPTTSVTPAQGYEILARQRLNRPVTPHLTIYRPQLTWTLSALNRITGSALSGGFYIFGFAYLVSPLFGWHLDSAHIAEVVGAWHPAVKGSVKFLIALPFTFHSWNGIRHLIWDSGRSFANKNVVRTGWAVVGLTVVSSAVLAFGY